MPEIAELLAEAAADVPVSDLDTADLARKVARRRRGRRARRGAAVVCAAAVVAGGVALGVGADGAGDERRGPVVAGPPTTAPSDQPTADGAPAVAHVHEFADRLASTPHLDTARVPIWATTPADMVGGSEAEPEVVVTGRVTGVRAGDRSVLCLDEQLGCLATFSGQITVQVTDVLRGRPGAAAIAVPFPIWSTAASTGADRSVADLAVQPYVAVAPIGAEVLVLGTATGDEAATVVPAGGPASIVFADAQGRAVVPHPNPAQALRPETFDEYVAEVVALLSD